MNDRVFDFIENLEFTPGSPVWRAMSESERHLATFAALMRDHANDGLWNVACSGDMALYVGALRAIGANWLADEIQAIADIEDIGSDTAEDLVERTCQNVEARHTELWDAAGAYAKTCLPSSSWGE